MKKKIFTLILCSFQFLTCSFAKNLTNEKKATIIEFKSNSSGFDTRTYFYIGADEVIAIDSQFTPQLAEESISYLRQFTDKPISTLIITHPNPDKFNGASVFKKLGATIIASKATSEAISGVHEYKKYFFVNIAKMFTNENYPQPVPVDQTFTEELKLNLKNNDFLLLKELKYSGVSSTQTVVFSKNMNSIFVGDLIHNKAHAWLEGGIIQGKATPTISKWIKDLVQLKNLFKSNPTVYAGRGISMPLNISVDSQIKYLNRSVQIIKDQISESKLTVNDINSEKEKKFYTDLQDKFKTEFPDYDLSYMILYGSYGLVQSLLK